MVKHLKQNRKLIYALQILWILMAVVFSLVIIVKSNEWFGIEYEGDSSVASAKGTDTVQNDSESNQEVIKENGNGKDGNNENQDPAGDLGEIEKEAAEKEAAEKEAAEKEAAEKEAAEKAAAEKEAEEKAAAKPEKREIDATKPMVALTFDDGPYPPVTNKIVETLQKYGARATFFIMGSRIEEYGETIIQAFKQGNQIANHTWNHKDLTTLKSKDIIYEVEYVNERINEIFDAGDMFLRPPNGASSEVVCSMMKVPMILWSVDTLDWRTRDKIKVFEEVKKSVKDGSIVLLHDLYSSTAEAMELVIPWLIEEGYQVVTVQEMFEAKGILLEAGKVYHNARVKEGTTIQE